MRKGAFWAVVAVLVGVPQTTATLNMRDLFSARRYIGSIGGSSRPDRDFPIYVQWFKEGKLPLDLLVTRNAPTDVDLGRGLRFTRH